MSDNRNLFLVIALSLAIVILWQEFVVGPMTPPPPAAVTTDARAPAAGGEPAPVTDVGSTISAPAVPQAGVNLPRAEVIASGARVAILSDAVDGSILLNGARFDDLNLRRYRERVDPQSDEITLLSPKGTANPDFAYFAEFGWAAAPGGTVLLPGADTPWRLAAGDVLSPGKPVTLEWDNGQGFIFRRTIALDDNYMFTVTDAVENRSGSDVALYPYGLIARHGGEPLASIWVIHEGLLGVFDGTLEQFTFSDMQDEPVQSFDTAGGWLGITDHYWLAALAPDQNEPIIARFTRDARDGRNIYQTDFRYSAARIAAAGQTISVTHHLFAGAKSVSVVDGYEENLGIKRFDLAIDWGWFFFLTKPIFLLLDFIQSLIGNFGVAILILTVLIKALFFPLANKSYESMSKMKKIQPEMLKLRERFKEDPQRLQAEMMGLYKREKVNPVSGCLPILIQIPVFFSLYKVLYVSLEMRHKPFFGWVQDLSAVDPTNVFNLFGLLPYEPWSFLHIGVWPLIMGISMWVQMKMNPPAADPVQQRIFSIMPWFFMFLMASFPAGLVIYWAWNNTLSVAQQYFIMRRMKVEIHLFDNLKASFIVRLVTGRIGRKPDPGAKG